MPGSNNPNERHITPHHAWAYPHHDPVSELSTTEHDHILDCERCLRLFILHLKSQSFGSVCKALGNDLDERRSAWLGCIIFKTCKRELYVKAFSRRRTRAQSGRAHS